MWGTEVNKNSYWEIHRLTGQTRWSNNQATEVHLIQSTEKVTGLHCLLRKLISAGSKTCTRQTMFSHFVIINNCQLQHSSRNAHTYFCFPLSLSLKALHQTNATLRFNSRLKFWYNSNIMVLLHMYMYIYISKNWIYLWQVSSWQEILSTWVKDSDNY